MWVLGKYCSFYLKHTKKGFMIEEREIQKNYVSIGNTWNMVHVEI